MGWNIYYDLEKSKFEVEYKRFRFIFSSQFYLSKFEKDINNFISIEKQKFNLRYGAYLKSDEFLALTLYKKIEKRGFLVYFDGRKINPNTTFRLSISCIDNI